MKLICIGRNYVDHAKELNNPLPKKPIFFSKPDTSLLRNNEAFYLPSFSNEIHHEIELVVRMDKLGKNIEKKFAHKYYNEIGLGVDFTARDLQAECKKNGMPWEIAKAFDNSAPISEFINKNEFETVQDIDFSLNINNKPVQVGNSKDMIFDIDTIIEYISQFYTLKIGDLIYTGTPAGVGAVKIGDRLEGFIGDKKMLDFEIK